MDLFKRKIKVDDLRVNMQDEILRVSALRLGHEVSNELVNNVRDSKWSYMGLEMILDSVKTIDIDQIEIYLSQLDQ